MKYKDFETLKKMKILKWYTTKETLTQTES